MTCHEYKGMTWHECKGMAWHEYKGMTWHECKGMTWHEYKGMTWHEYKDTLIISERNEIKVPLFGCKYQYLHLKHICLVVPYFLFVVFRKNTSSSALYIQHH